MLQVSLSLLGEAFFFDRDLISYISPLNAIVSLY